MVTQNIKTLVNKIKDLTDGLIYISETDSTFETVCIEKNGRPTVALIKELADRPTGKIVTDEPNKFFSRLIRDREWHSAEKKKQNKRYKALSSLLEKELSDLKVYRIGRVSIDIFIVGDYEQYTVGVRTKAVET